MDTFKTLYETDSKNKLRLWDIKVFDKGEYSEIHTIHGLENGKKTVKIIKITQGKNIGKANETSHYEQAILEAKSKWEQKQKKGYTLDRFSQSETKFPMLAKEFLKNKKKVIYPCLGQPKIDGVRCVYNNGEFYSRMGKMFYGLNHIKDELIKFGNSIIDGELYSYSLNFNKLVGIVKSETLSTSQKSDELKIIFIAYDIFSNKDYSTRLSNLKATIIGNNFKYVNIIETEDVHSEEEVYMFHKKFISKGYEGIMIRNKKGIYEEKKRSNNLLKYKSFFDSEYKIVNFTSEKLIEDGKERDLVIWICETEKGDKFNVRPHGCFEDRELIFKNAHKYIGALLTVKYQELTPDGIPRFGIGVSLSATGVAIRDYE